MAAGQPGANHRGGGVLSRRWLVIPILPTLADMGALGEAVARSPGGSWASEAGSTRCGPRTNFGPRRPGPSEA